MQKSEQNNHIIVLEGIYYLVSVGILVKESNNLLFFTDSYIYLIIK